MAESEKARPVVDAKAYGKLKRFAQVAYGSGMTFPAFVEMLAQYLPANDEAMSAGEGRRAIIRAVANGPELTKRETER